MSLLPSSTNPLSNSGEIFKSELPKRRKSSPTPIKTSAHKTNKITLPKVEKPINHGSNLKDTPRTKSIKELKGTVCNLEGAVSNLVNWTQYLKVENDDLKEKLAFLNNGVASLNNGVASLDNRVSEIVAEELTGFDPSKRNVPDGMYS